MPACVSVRFWHDLIYYHFLSFFKVSIFNLDQAPNGLRYPRWGGRRNAVRLGKG